MPFTTQPFDASTGMPSRSLPSATTGSSAGAGAPVSTQSRAEEDQPSRGVLGVAPGEVGTIRNVGGRVTPGLLREMVMLRKVVQAGGGDIGPGWEFVVLHHTGCGITGLEGQPEMLSEFFEVDQDQLAEQAVSDPAAAVALDVATLRADTRLPGVRVSGLVYEVNTGLVDTVVKP